MESTSLFPFVRACIPVGTGYDSRNSNNAQFHVAQHTGDSLKSPDLMSARFRSPTTVPKGNSQPRASMATVPTGPMEIEGSLLPWATVNGTLLKVTVASVVAAEASIEAMSASTSRPAS